MARDGGVLEEQTVNSAYGGGSEAGELISKSEGWEVAVIWEAFPPGNVRPSPPHLPGLPTPPVPRSPLEYRRWLLNYQASHSTFHSPQCSVASPWPQWVLHAPHASRCLLSSSLMRRGRGPQRSPSFLHLLHDVLASRRL